jgi:hypothetical protein
MNQKVVALNDKGVTPEFLLNEVSDVIDELEAMYIVGIDKNGEARFWGKGTLRDMAFAKLVFEDLSLRYFNDSLDADE